MSVIQVKLRSGSLMRPVDFTMFLPDDRAFMRGLENAPSYARPTKTLLILHGYTVDNYE